MQNIAHIKHSKSVGAGIFWTLFSCFFSGIMVNMVKHVAIDLHTVQIIFFRNVFAFLMFIPIIGYMGLSHFKTKRIGTHIMRSLTGLISMTIYFYAISKMNISVVTALSFTAPLFTAFFAIYFFKDKPNIHQIFGLFMGFVGIVIVVQPSSEHFDPLSLLVLISAVFWALSGIIIKKLSQTEPALTTTFYMTFFMIILSLPMAIYEWKQPSLDNYLWVFGIALSSNFLQYGIAKSLAAADFSVVLPFDFTRLVFSATIAYFVFDENMDMDAALGSVVILAAAFYSALNERRKIRKLAAMSQVNKPL